jgi:hypothetical protein
MAEYEASGLSRREYCLRKGLAAGLFDYQRQKYLKRQRPEFVRVELATGHEESAERRIRMELGNGRRLSVDWDGGEETLARVVRAMERT